MQGYDITDEAHLGAVLDEADAKVGIDRLGAVHVNDAAAPLGSCRDRHANIGKGEMGKRGLAAFLSEPRFEGLPATLETPGPEKKGSDKKEVTLAKRLRREGLKRRERPEPAAVLWDAIGGTKGLPQLRSEAGDKDRPGLAGPCSPAVNSLFDVDAGDRAGDDQALDL